MAKQSGLHQIRGKVGEHSYYRQTGVVNGLIRSINQGLSSRVKTSDEYANTRLNDAEFGQAVRIAKVCGRLIIPKFRPMILPFSQSKMAKIILSAIKTDSASWGERNLSSNATDRIDSLVIALNSVSKGDFDSFGVSISKGQGNDIDFIASLPLFSSKLQSIGSDGCTVNVVYSNPFIGKYINGVGYAASYVRGNVYEFDLEPESLTQTLVPNFPASAPEGSIWMSGNFLVFVIMPYRIINDRTYVLQEYCAFKAMQVPV